MWDTNIKGDHEQVKGIKIRMARSLYSTLIVFAWEPLRSKISRLASQSCSRALVTKRHKEHMIVEFTELGLRKIFRLGNLPRLDRRGGNLLVIYSTWHNHVVCSVNFLILNFRSIEKSLSSSDGSPWASWRHGLGWGVSEISPVGSSERAAVRHLDERSTLGETSREPSGGKTCDPRDLVNYYPAEGL